MQQPGERDVGGCCAEFAGEGFVSVEPVAQWRQARVLAGVLGSAGEEAGMEGAVCDQSDAEIPKGGDDFELDRAVARL